MAINLKLNDRFTFDPTRDAMHRTWVGWSPDLTDQEVYEQNRGVWVLGRRARGERLATFSHHGVVVAVVAIDGIEDIPPLEGRTPKQAIIGRVLQAGDADYDALINTPVDHHRNPVTYSSSDRRTCACGCGTEVAGNRAFLPGHDQRAVHERIAQEWGTTLGFIEWFDAKYGAPNGHRPDAVALAPAPTPNA